MFQFTHPCGCDSGAVKGDKAANGFNSRTRVGATMQNRAHLRPILFQFTHPCGCDSPFQALNCNPYRFQFTHPCGCDCFNGPRGIDDGGFNSRTRVGATRPVEPSTLRMMFQFTHPCGCDQIPFRRTGQGTVSIHAPVWVRQFLKNCGIRITGFQFTHPCGCDFLGIYLPSICGQFQFTHPCGCDFLICMTQL